MTSPSLPSRESTTWSARWPQYGHFMASSRMTGLRLVGEPAHPGDVQASLRGKQQAEEDDRANRQQMQHDRRRDGCIVGHGEEHGRPDAERFVEPADGARG